MSRHRTRIKGNAPAGSETGKNWQVSFINRNISNFNKESNVLKRLEMHEEVKF